MSENYRTFDGYLKAKLGKHFNVANIKNEGGFCKIFPKESMSVNELRQLYNFLGTLEYVKVEIDNPTYIVAYHDG